MTTMEGASSTASGTNYTSMCFFFFCSYAESGSSLLSSLWCLFLSQTSGLSCSPILCAQAVDLRWQLLPATFYEDSVNCERMLCVLVRSVPTSSPALRHSSLASIHRFSACLFSGSLVFFLSAALPGSFTPSYISSSCTPKPAQHNRLITNKYKCCCFTKFSTTSAVYVQPAFYFIFYRQAAHPGGSGHVHRPRVGQPRPPAPVHRGGARLPLVARPHQPRHRLRQPGVREGERYRERGGGGGK